MDEDRKQYLERVRATFATVDELIVILQKISDAGCGDYIVGCNEEYYVALKNEKPEIDKQSRTIDMGGYDLY